MSDLGFYIGCLLMGAGTGLILRTLRENRRMARKIDEEIRRCDKVLAMK